LTQPPRALVIGAGLAGSASARALARHGWTTTVVSAPPGSDASDIPAAVLAPPPLPGNDPVTAFRYRAGRVARAWYASIEAGPDGRACLGSGLLLVPGRERDHRRFGQLPDSGDGPIRVSPGRASALSGAEIDTTCVHHPHGGWFAPAALRQAALVHPCIQPTVEAGVAAIRRRDGLWTALASDGTAIAAAPVCVVAAGIASARLLPALTSRLTPARGQATAVAGGCLRMAVSGNGYAVPDADGRLWLGATIARGDDDPRPREADDERNLAVFAQLWPSAPLARPTGAFTAVRATTRDRLPLAGQLDEGLWVNTGHGTQGLLSTPVSALLLARAITGAGSHPLLARLQPDRPTLTRHPGPSATILP
jgi:tRNA 5-methylaminomethyl-2-thiouridine biosynthesis bifunctional protein